MSYVFQMVQNQGVAEDTVQEVFLRVYRNRESYEPRAKFSTWLWTIARNAALDHLRKKQDELMREAPGEEGGEAPAAIEQVESPMSNAEELLLERADQARVERCMSGLSALQREALSLRTVSELSYEEIAEAMGTTLPSVKSLINRAKTALTECLRECLEGGGNE